MSVKSSARKSRSTREKTRALDVQIQFMEGVVRRDPRYVEALQALEGDPAAGAVLFIHAPSAIVPSADIARALVPLQDLLALDHALQGPPEKERINVPGTVNETNWSYRMPLFLEDLLRRGELNTKIRKLCTLRLP